MKLLKNKKNNYPAYYNYLIAGEAINAMFQYFNKIRFAPVDSRLDIDFYHQYGPMLAELYERIKNGSNIIYSFTISTTPFNYLIFEHILKWK